MKIVESRNMLEEIGSEEEKGEGKEVTKSGSSISEEEGVIEVGEGRDVGNSSSISEEGDAAEIGEGKDVTNSSSSMSEEGETEEGKDRLDVNVLLEVES